ncbi:hypothetical protein GCM10010520_17540 [Rhizobium viscosum]
MSETTEIWIEKGAQVLLRLRCNPTPFEVKRTLTECNTSRPVQTSLKAFAAVTIRRMHRFDPIK